MRNKVEADDVNTSDMVSKVIAENDAMNLHQPGQDNTVTIDDLIPEEMERFQKIGELGSSWT